MLARKLSTHQPKKKIALLGSPILPPVNNLMNAALARHAAEVGNWEFIYSAKNTVKTFRFLRNLDCDGAIVRITSPAMRREAMKIRFPIVNISSWLEHPGVPTVCIDWRKLGQLAAEHLLEKGYRRFGCVITPGGWFVRERFAAVMETLASRGLNASLFHLNVPHTSSSDYPNFISKAEQNRFKDWVRTLRPPAALVLTDDWDAPQLLRICRVAGHKIPQDLAVISTGIHSEMIPLCQPPLTGAQEDFEQQADLAIHCLENQMAGKKVSLKPVSVPPLGVIERTSTATIAVGDRTVAHAIELIRVHGCDQSVNVAHLARNFLVCRATLERRFLKTMGQTLYHYIIAHRIKRAKELLAANPPRSLRVIARECGIPDRRRLNRIFRRVTGKSPISFRRAALKSTRPEVKKRNKRNNGCDVTSLFQAS